MGPFVFSFPYITAPDTEGKFADGKYKVDAVGAPGSPGIAAAEDHIKKALKEFGLPTKGTGLPLKKEIDKGQDGKKVETGKLILRAKSKFAPAVVDANAQPIPDKALAKMKISGGSEGFIEGYFAPYESTEKVRNADGELETVTVRGVNFTLTGVQLTKLVKAGVGGSSFAAQGSGGFSYQGTASDEDDGDSGLDYGSSDEPDEGDEGGLDI